ncbi:MAG TPA: multicopper oxidase domain-containing protein [Kofleriaceae bacterium]|nr:multicopper oxidase domain-containing protein [Kofleriaceae bacterium]
MTFSRRTVLRSGLGAGAIVLASKRLALAEPQDDMGMGGMDMSKPKPTTRARAVAGESYTPVVVPNGSTLPFEKKGGVKVFHLVAEPVTHTIAPGLDIEAWGYNGGTPGPLIEAVEGDRVRIYVTNKLAERTTVHWHGVFVPNGMDGVGGLTQAAIPPGKTFKYEFDLVKPGTFMYHPHFDEMTQIALGMVGMFVVHPRVEKDTHRVRDYSLLTHEWKVPIGARRPDPMAMNDFNVLTFNSKAFPATESLVAEVGDRVRIRLGNLGPMDHHPIHLHGYAFEVAYTDGGPVPKTARWPETTVLVPVGAVRVIELVADTPGDWALHCHMTHHVMNQMGHDAPNLVGADVRGVDKRIGRVVPGYMTMGATGMGDMMEMRQPDNSISMLGGDGPFGMIDMGGMFTILKVRTKLEEGKDPGWFEHPKGTVAAEATDAELSRDGIKT